MSIHYITALFLPSGKIYRPINKYIEHFHELAVTNIQIGLYLDERLKDQTDIIVGSFKNITVLDYITVDASYVPANVIVPQNRNLQKDNVDYFTIQLMKLNLCAKAANDDRITAANIAWIDFGIFHMIHEKDTVRRFLESYKVPERCTKILNPGCWNIGNYEKWDSIIWRFCGSLLIGPRNCWATAYELQQQKVLEGLPRITWEVNYWTMMESVFEWYKANHNDSIILSLPTT